MAPIAESGPAIVAALQGVTPGGESPLVPALTGAFALLKERAAARPEREAVLAMVGPGAPTLGDDRDAGDVTAVIAAAHQTDPEARVGVIGGGAP